jgi:hypothetical protein
VLARFAMRYKAHPLAQISDRLNDERFFKRALFLTIQLGPRGFLDNARQRRWFPAAPPTQT